MKVLNESQNSTTAYCTADELIDGDEVCGMVFDEGVPMYLVQRRKEGEKSQHKSKDQNGRTRVDDHANGVHGRSLRAVREGQIMYKNSIFSADGTFRFGTMCISPGDIEFGMIPMLIVEALVRRIRDHAPFFVQVGTEDSNCTLAYLENFRKGDPCFVVYKAKFESTVGMSYVKGVTLRDFAARVVYDLSTQDMSDVYASYIGPGYAYFKWHDLQQKLSELKLLMKDADAFASIPFDKLCGFDVQIGEDLPFYPGIPVCEDGDAPRWRKGEEYVAEIEKNMNSCYLESVQRSEGWFLTKCTGEVVDGPYAAQSCVHELGFIYLRCYCNKYREKEESECDEELKANWTGESERISEMRERGFKSKVILAVLDLLKTDKPSIKPIRRKYRKQKEEFMGKYRAVRFGKYYDVALIVNTPAGEEQYLFGKKMKTMREAREIAELFNAEVGCVSETANGCGAVCEVQADARRGRVHRVDDQADGVRGR